MFVLTIIDKKPPKQIKAIMERVFVCEAFLWEQIQAGAFRRIVNRGHSYYFILRETEAIRC